MARILKSYFDSLVQLQLHSEMNEMIKYGPKDIEWIKEIEKKNSMITLICPYCLSKDAKALGSMCENCERHSARCALCQLPVEGPYLWCQVCSHGGHYEHINTWFKTSKQCPVGCGH